MLDLSWADPTRVTPTIREGYQAPLRAKDWERGLWELVRASSWPRLAERLADLKAPALVITGDADRIVSTEQSVRLSRALPDARLVVVPDCAHLPHEECAGVFLDAVRAFVTELRAQ